MADGGVSTKGRIVADSKLHRVHIEGDRKGSRNGWYVLHPDAPQAGAFGSWRTGINGRWRVGISEKLSEEERERLTKMREQQQREMAELQRQRHETAAQRARRMWGKALVEYDQEDHQYLADKKIGCGSARLLGDWLLVPLYSAERKLIGLQIIKPDGTKRFLTGTAKRGAYCPIGEVKSGLIICEGYATGMTLHQASGQAVAVAFDCGNLLPVAQELRAKLGPDVKIILAADNDRRTDGNPGITAATEVAEKVANCRVAVPDLPVGSHGSDFNDLYQELGAGAVRSGLNRGMWDLQDLVNTKFPDRLWLVRPILGPGLTLLVGSPKTGKSRMATQLAVAAAYQNGVFCGGFSTGPQTDVLYLDLEDDVSGSTARILHLLEGDVVPSGVTVSNRWPVIGQGCVAALREFLDHRPRTKLVVIDTLARVWDVSSAKKRGNAYHQEHEVLTRLRDVAVAYGVAILVVHHDSKFDTRDPMMKVSGTRAMTGVPDALWLIERGLMKEEGKLIVTGRIVTQQEYKMRFVRASGSWTLAEGLQQAEIAN